MVRRPAKTGGPRRRTRRKKEASAPKPEPRKPAAGKPEKSTPVDSVTLLAESDAYPIVGVGASAGGLETFAELLRSIPAEPGLAFVFIFHVDPKQPAVVPRIIERATKMKIVEAVDEMSVERDTIYIAPPSSNITIENGVLHIEQLPGISPSMPIDHFFRSLAEDQGNRAIAVVLSGAASDGAIGTKSVKAEGGITFAQDDSATFQSMPRSAVAAGAIDFVLSPAEIARELLRIGKHAYMRRGVPPRFPEGDMARLFSFCTPAMTSTSLITNRARSSAASAGGWLFTGSTSSTTTSVCCETTRRRFRSSTRTC